MGARGFPIETKGPRHLDQWLPPIVRGSCVARVGWWHVRQVGRAIGPDEGSATGALIADKEPPASKNTRTLALFCCD